MKIACLITLLAGFVSAADVPIKPDTVESLRAENELLKANLAQVRLQFQYQMQVCQSLDMMQAGIATIQAQQKVDAAKPKKESDPIPPKK